jgi:outer membrane protein assembly factor BamC
MRRGLILMVPLVVLLAACGVSDGTKVDYKSASSGPKLPPLEVPPDLTQPGRDDRYQVPEVAGSNAGGTTTLSTYNSERNAVPKPGSTDVLPDIGAIKLVRDGSQRWLLVPEPAEKIWPILRDFWRDNGFLLKVDSPQTGVMETDWAENRAKINDDIIHNMLGKLLDSAYSTGERDKFRTRVERGTDPNTTEIYVSHRGMVETLITTNAGQEGQTMWQPRQPDPGLESEFLRRLMLRLGADQMQAKVALASGSSPDKARIRDDASGNGSLEVLEPFDRAWRRVGLALDRVGFTVEDRDRESGQYYVRYVEPNTDAPADKGLLSWIGLGGSSKPKVDPKDEYRVRVRGEGDASSEVSVLNKDGKADNSSAAKRILGLLQEQLR